MIISKNHLLYLYFLAGSLIGCSENSKKNENQNADLQLGVALYSFNRFSFADAIEKADSAGVNYVEGFSFHKLGKEFNENSMSSMSEEDISNMKQMLKKKNIKMQSMYVSGAKNEDDWKYYFELAKKMKMQYLVCEPEKESWDMLDSLAGLYQIKIAIHEHAKGKSIYWHPDSVLKALKNHPNFGVCADLGHWARSGLNPSECLKKLEGHILGVHLKDIHESNNTEAIDVIVGTGVIDFPSVVDELKRQHFNGIVHVECEHKMENNLPDVIEAIRYFEELYNPTQ
ncbi:MAG: sugar phosphate isomerase/epimerase [Arenibacter algicola]